MTFDFQLGEKLAQGGFGAVYRATHTGTGTSVAIKLLHPQFAEIPEVVARFEREAAALAQLQDPHTVTLYGHGDRWLAMELVTGESLYERFAACGAMPWRKVVSIARQVCSSLAEAHALGIIHRDLKPANIVLRDPDDFVKVIDFGIAKVLADTLELTHAGQMLGTYDYMAPEQLVGGEVSAASDLYTLGVVMYEMIAGVRPFPDIAGPASMLGAVLTRTPAPLGSLANVPAQLESIVMRCLSLDASDRFASAGELVAALDALSPDPADTEVTRVMVMPRFPLPPPPAFEARGSDASISKPRFETVHELRARRMFWWGIAAIVVAAVAAALAA